MKIRKMHREELVDYYSDSDYRDDVYDFVDRVENLIKDVDVETLTEEEAIKFTKAVIEQYERAWNSIGWGEAEKHFRALGHPEWI